jgi:hypothetical protein
MISLTHSLLKEKPLLLKRKKMAMAICHLIKHIDIAHCQVGETHAWWATPISFIPLLYHPPRISQNSKHCHG